MTLSSSFCVFLFVCDRSDKTSISYPAGELPQRTEDVLLRLLCRIGTYESATVARVVDELQRLSRIPSSMTLAQALRGLLLVQILFTDVIQRKVNQGSNDIKSTAAVQFGNKFANSDRLNGCFVPEVPRFLMRLLSTACVEGGLLHLTEDASSLEELVASLVRSILPLLKRIPGGPAGGCDGSDCPLCNCCDAGQLCSTCCIDY